MAGLTVMAVRDASEIRRFLDVAYQLHHDEPRWVPPLRSDLVARVRRRRNPFWRRADGRLFLARRGSKMVGRISVQLDATEDADRTTALWGWFESVDDEQVARVLLDTAAAWARDAGAGRMIGPASFHALDEAGLLVEGHDEPASFLSPWHPPAYQALIESCGAAPAGELVTLRMDVAHRAHEALDGRDGGGTDAEQPRLREVEREVVARAGGLAGRVEGNPATWAPTLSEVRAQWRRLHPILDRSLCVVADSGLAVAVPDLNEVLVRLKGRLGPGAAARLLSEARRARHGAAVAMLSGAPEPLLARLLAGAAAAGYQRIEAVAAVTAEPVTGALHRLGAQTVRRYRTYALDL